MVQDTTLGSRLLSIFCYTLIGIFALLSLAPIWIIIVASFTDNATLSHDGYWFWSREWSLAAYEFVMAGNEIQVGYRVTTFVTIVGTIASLVVMSGLAYVMSVRHFKGRDKLAFFVYFTMIFSGGIVPWFITMRMLGLTDNLWGLIIPMLVNPWWVFILRNFFGTIPGEIVESARIDGATDFQILFQIILPLSLPALATVGLFMAVAFWNDWFHGMMLLTFADFRPLSVILLRMVRNVQAIQIAMQQPGVSINVTDLPTLSIRMATTVLTVGPIIILYPFAQRFFIKGLTVGSIKG